MWVVEGEIVDALTKVQSHACKVQVCRESGSFPFALLFFPKVSEEHSCPFSADSAVEVSDVKSAWDARRPFVLLSVASQPDW